MSGQESFSNADTGSKPADPYTAKNKDETPLSTKVDDLAKFIAGCKFGMMTTRIGPTGLMTSRCMALAAQEAGGIDLIFHTNTESGKTDSLATDPSINIAFLNGSGEWASVAGEATVTTDREMIRKYYSRALKAWIGDLGDGKHDGGPEDPRIGVIKVTAKQITYAIVNQNPVGRGIEFVKGVATGDAPNIQFLRDITEDELAEWRKTHE
ncbi:hypothetical protein MMC25_007507 [Agyrium rufum]|nr:hypothetical protein [Agyrium rufum]